jgi:hypothetical protein
MGPEYNVVVDCECTPRGVSPKSGESENRYAKGGESENE